jgi:hypothetical protein
MVPCPLDTKQLWHIAEMLPRELSAKAKSDQFVDWVHVAMTNPADYAALRVAFKKIQEAKRLLEISDMADTTLRLHLRRIHSFETTYTDEQIAEVVQEVALRPGIKNSQISKFVIELIMRRDKDSSDWQSPLQFS